jgi:hypothetical protein
MPKGVEHAVVLAYIYAAHNARSYEMPKGVEHTSIRPWRLSRTGEFI